MTLPLTNTFTKDAVFAYLDLEHRATPTNRSFFEEIGYCTTGDMREVFFASADNEEVYDWMADWMVSKGRFDNPIEAWNYMFAVD